MAAVLSIVGGVVGAIGAMQAASAQAQAAEYNAQVAERNRLIALNQADQDASEQRRENMRKYSAIRAAYGTAGIDLAGSPLEVLYESALEGEMDAERARYAGELRALEQGDRAELSRMEAKNARAAGPISAMSSLFGGFSKGIGLSLQAA